MMLFCCCVFVGVCVCVFLMDCFPCLGVCLFFVVLFLFFFLGGGAGGEVLLIVAELCIYVVYPLLFMFVVFLNHVRRNKFDCF